MGAASDNPLFDRIEQGDLAGLESLLPRTEEDARDDALGFAVLEDKPAAVAALLDWCSADMQLEALVNAACMGRTEIITHLVEHITPRPSPRHIGKALILAATEGHLPVVEALLPRAQEEACEDAMKEAAHHGHQAVLERLLPTCKPQAVIFHFVGEEAIRGGHPACLEKTLPFVHPHKRLGLMIHALRSGHQDCVDLLAPKLNLHALAVEEARNFQVHTDLLAEYLKPETLEIALRHMPHNLPRCRARFDAQQLAAHTPTPTRSTQRRI